jgi:flagellar motor switch protein FliG
MAPKDDTTPDSEAVNGAAIAAEILKRLEPENRQRILKEMELRSPALVPQVESNLYRFEEITELSTQGIQTLVREVDHNDLVASLRGAPPAVKKAVLENMSGRKLQMVTDDLENLPQHKAVEVKEAQRRIMRLIDDLRCQGKILSDTKGDKKGRYA